MLPPSGWLSGGVGRRVEVGDPEGRVYVTGRPFSSHPPLCPPLIQRLRPGPSSPFGWHHKDLFILEGISERLMFPSPCVNERGRSDTAARFSPSSRRIVFPIRRADKISVWNVMSCRYERCGSKISSSRRLWSPWGGAKCVAGGVKNVKWYSEHLYWLTTDRDDVF